MDLHAEHLSPRLCMDEVWLEMVTIFETVFSDVENLVRAIVVYLSRVPPTSALGPTHNQVHVLGNLLDLPVMQNTSCCNALSQLPPHEGT